MSPIFEELIVPAHVPAESFEENTRYTIGEFQKRCSESRQIIELAIMKLVSLRIAENRKLKPNQVTATGAEIRVALQAATRVAHLFQSRPVHLRVPGMPPICLSESMPALFTDLFK
jgi:hypothetical protein